MKNLVILILLLSIGLTSCDPTKRLAHLEKHHPELIKSDTTYTTLHDTMPAIAVRADFKTDKNVSGVDTILNQLKGRIDSISRLKISNEIKNYVVNRPIIQDTIRKVVNGVTVKMYMIGNDIGISIDKAAEIHDKKVATAIHTVLPPTIIALTWGQKIKIWIFDNGWWIFIILWLVRKIFGNKIKAAVPWLSFLF